MNDAEDHNHDLDDELSTTSAATTAAAAAATTCRRAPAVARIDPSPPTVQQCLARSLGLGHSSGSRAPGRMSWTQLFHPCIGRRSLEIWGTAVDIQGFKYWFQSDPFGATIPITEHQRCIGAGALATKASGPEMAPGAWAYPSQPAP